MMTRPLIGITVDNRDPDKYESNLDYSRAVVDAGGVPLLLPQEVDLAAHYVELCDGLMLTGGADVRSVDFGIPAHPESHCMEPRRQAFERALLTALNDRTQFPVLGICMGMQLMAMHAGGRMNQHLPEFLPNAVGEHQNNHCHPVLFEVGDSAMLRLPDGGWIVSDPEFPNQTVVSSHHQGVEESGGLRVVARSPDGVIEAIDDPTRPFYVGVQWHPERGEGLLNRDLIRRFVEACSLGRPF